jgi:carboxymethylenebutenolidase
MTSEPTRSDVLGAGDPGGPATAPDQPSYLAEPGDGGPGVLVVHDYYGLLPSVRECCDALADAGFVALAPDLYDGRVAGDDDEAERLMDDLATTSARKRLGEAIGWLRTAARGGRVGAVGFSMGGSLALREATTGTLDAVVAYYATLDPASARSVGCPVLLQVAEIDDWDPEETPERFLELLRERGEAERFTYPGTEHSFANAGIPARFAPRATATAWTRTVAFLQGHLSG